MKILIKQCAINDRGQCGVALVDSERIFNFDALPLKHSKEELEFLKTLTPDKWVEIPPDLLDFTTRQNFVCYARLPR